jgi:hypothetical protein
MRTDPIRDAIEAVLAKPFVKVSAEDDMETAARVRGYNNALAEVRFILRSAIGLELRG